MGVGIMKIRRALTLDNRTSASNPGRAPVNMLRYAWFYPSWPLVLAISFLFSAFLVAKVSLWFLILLFPVLAFGFLYWIRIKEFFARGDANPGVVIQLDPTLVAVATDLSHSGGSYPAIKVFRTRLRWIMGEKVGLGTRLPTVALYTSSLDPKCPHWADFDPRPLECATGNRRVLNRVMHSFLERDWQRLEASVQRLPVAQPGLYQLRAWPKLPDIPAEHISEDEFWQIIENTKAPAKSEQIEVLKGELQRLPNDQLVGFRSHFMRRKLAAYNWDLWLVALLGQGGFCSDDGFADFLNWLISQGRAAYQCGLDDPDSLIEQIHAAENPRFESFGLCSIRNFPGTNGTRLPRTRPAVCAGTIRGGLVARPIERSDRQ